MNPYGLVFALTIFLMSSQSLAARQFEKIQIKGAVCGDGKPYYVFYEKRSNSKLAIMIQGGGACWDFLTCTTGITTKIVSRPSPPEKHGFSSTDFRNSPAADYSMLYFPYCTGDMFSGNHLAHYGPFANIRHMGKSNLKKSFSYLKNNRDINFSKFNELLLYGYSAGGIGLMFNLFWMDKNYFVKSQKKTVILDGIGLHWTRSVWKKFTPTQIKEMSESFYEIGIPFSIDDGLLAKYAVEVCQKFPDYQFGLLQGSKDLIMGLFFGLMNPFYHRKLVYGKKGIFQTTIKSDDNCSSWVPDTFGHTFLDGTRKFRQYYLTSDHTSALKYATDLIRYGARKSHK